MKEYSQTRFMSRAPLFVVVVPGNGQPSVARPAPRAVLAPSLSPARCSRGAGLISVNAVRATQAQLVLMAQIHAPPEKWLPVSIAPSDSDLEACVIENGEVYALVFPCRRIGDAWVDASTRKRIDIQPTHWRLWTKR